MIRFAQPFAFLLLAVVPFIIFFRFRHRRMMAPRMRFSATRILGRHRRTLRVRMRPLPTLLSLLALSLMIGSLARPQSPWQEKRRRAEGISIMLVIDVSESMRALDFEPNRMEKAKEVVKDFIRGRNEDLIGIVIFGKQTFTLCPLTHDYAALETFVNRIDFDLVDGNGTAIGMGLANGVNKINDAPGKSKVIILLTDGENNFGEIDPLIAADVAAQLKVRVYPIGIGSIGMVEIPRVTANGRRVTQTMVSKIDTDMLTKIADKTGGKFFHATDGKKLEEIYKEIDKMERTKVEEKERNYFDELAAYLIIPALLLFALVFFLEQTWLWSFP